MDREELSFLESPTRQSPVAILLILLRFIRILVRQGWPLIVIFFINPEKKFWTYVLIVSIIAAFLSTIFSIIAYFRFIYYVKDEELFIEKGIFQRTKLNIPFERIQSIHFKQNLIHQFFGVVSLEIDTAGSSQKEFSISALNREEAEAIREFVLSRKPAGKEDAGLLADEVVVHAEPKEKLLLSLSLPDLLKIGISQNHLRAAGILFAFFYGITEYTDDFLGFGFEDFVKKAIGTSGTVVLSILLIAVPLFLIVAIVLSLVRTFLRYFELKFFRTANGFKLIAGLFTRREQSAPLTKTQIVDWSAIYLQKLMKIFTLRLKQASSIEVAALNAIRIPGAGEEHLEIVARAYFPNLEQQQFSEHGISKLVIVRRMLFLGILPTIGFTLATVAPLGLGVLWWLLWLPLILFTSLRYQRKWRFFVSRDGLRIRKGIFGDQGALLQWYKVQSVKITQSIYQRRKGLADIIFYTASGDLRIPYIPVEKARELQDYVLYRVEVDDRPWM